MKHEAPLPISDWKKPLGAGSFIEVHESFVDENYVVKAYECPIVVEDAYGLYESTKTEYRKLKSIFGDIIPDSVFLFSEDVRYPNCKIIQITQERVFKLEDIEKEKLELIEFIKKCVIQYISTYNKDKQTGESVDVSVRNLIYGKTAADESPKLYFVDSGRPIFHSHISSYIAKLEYVMDKFNIDCSILDELKKLASDTLTPSDN